MQEEKPRSNQTSANELDLGIFFHLLGKVFRKIGYAIRIFFMSIFQFLLDILLFIKRNILWLGIGTVIGFGFGLFRYLSQGPLFESGMIVKANFESGKLLYNNITYFNSLVKARRVEKLSDIFGLPVNEASKLKSFEIEPVDDELEMARLYRSTFLDYKRNNINGADTLWTKTIKFKDFKKQLRAYDFPLQRITLFSNSPDVFSKVESGIIKLVNNNESLQALKETTISMLKSEDQILRRSLAGIDTLRQAYNKKMETISSADARTVFLSERDLRNPEIDLYDKELMLKDELIQNNKKLIEQRDILQVYSGFNATGNKVSVFRQDFATYSLWGFIISFAIILLIHLYGYLDRLDKLKSAK